LQARPGTGGAGHVQGYEGSDTSVHSVALLAGAFIGLLIFGFIVGYGTFKILSPEETVSGPAALVETGRVLPPAPRLQVDARKDLAAYQKEQQQTLETYGWMDQKAGVVRVPIDRAMDLLLEKGLPVRAESAASQKPVGGTGKKAAPPAGAPQGTQNPSGVTGGSLQ
jgi:hypothetical protein